MPIPGPPPPASPVARVEAGSPFWLQVHGVWVQAEGVVPTVTVEAARPSSSTTSMDGNRYEQRARVARRSWSWSLPYAAAAHVALLRAAAESKNDVWLYSEHVGASNMLPPRACFGTTLPAIDCGGVPLPVFDDGAVLVGRVRGGVATTVSCWSTALAGVDVATIAYPGGTTTLDAAGSNGQGTVTFTPTSDGAVTITIAAGSWSASGLMLTEGAPEPTFVAGEEMPCKVVVDDPADVLRMHHGGTWRHNYTFDLREVG